MHVPRNNKPKIEEEISLLDEIPTIGDVEDTSCGCGDYLYGKLNKEILYYEYKGSTTNTASTNIVSSSDDAEGNRAIEVDVIRVPYQLIIKEIESSKVFDGSNNVLIDLTPYGKVANEVSSAIVKYEDGINYLVFSNSSGDELFRVNISSFIQEQSDLAVTDPTLETFVKNKSTKYLVNEGDGTLVDGNVDPYVKVSELEATSSELQEAIANEVLARDEADKALQETIDAVSSDLDTHINNKNNPHEVTKSQIGLGNVDNTSDKDKPISDAQAAINSQLNSSVSNLNQKINDEAAIRGSQDEALNNKINAINNKISSDATSENPLVSKEYVDTKDQEIESKITDLSDNIDNKLDQAVVQSISLLEPVADSSGDKNVHALKETMVNLGSGETSEATFNLPLASFQESGLLSAAGVRYLATALQNGSIKIKSVNPEDGTFIVTQTTIVGTKEEDGSMSYTSSTEDIVIKIPGIITQNGSQTITGDLTIAKNEDNGATGNLTVQGNLDVKGTTSTINSETLTVQDNLIITNDGGIDLSQYPSGLAIKTGVKVNSEGVEVPEGTSDSFDQAYAIVYSKQGGLGGSVKLGLGYINADNEFIFSEGVPSTTPYIGFPVATRADSEDSSMVDGTLMQWDEQTHSIKGSGVSASNVNKNTSDISSLTNRVNAAEENIQANSQRIDNNESYIDAINEKIPSDASSTNQLATENYVEQNGGKINSISINGTPQTIDANKNVNLEIPSSEIISTTYEALKALRDNNDLQPGVTYRLTDYICTTLDAETRSAGNVFDILLIANSNNVLDENARAINHEGDTYFSSSNLNTWELKYCLDNDTNRFAWADPANGKGVIYYMKDDHNNVCWYDFKNIQFKRYKVTNSKYIDNITNRDGSDVYIDGYIGTPNQKASLFGSISSSDFIWCYTFNHTKEDKSPTDASVLYEVIGDAYINDSVSIGAAQNRIDPLTETVEVDNEKNYTRYVLNNNVFTNLNFSGIYQNESSLEFIDYFNSPVSNILGVGCRYNTFGNNCSGNKMEEKCSNNILLARCVNNYFSTECFNNGIGFYCTNNKYLNGCSNNFLPQYSSDNIFYNNVAGCFSNTFLSIIKCRISLSSIDLTSSSDSGEFNNLIIN